MHDNKQDILKNLDAKDIKKIGEGMGNVGKILQGLSIVVGGALALVKLLSPDKKQRSEK